MYLIDRSQTGWRRFKRFGTIIGIVGVTAGAIVSVAKALPIIEPWWYASRGHVAEKIADVKGQQDQKINELLIWKFEDAKSRAVSEAGQIDVLMKKEADPDIRAILQKNLDRAKADQKKYDERIKELGIRQ